jgi:hypothetical protein
MNDVKKIKINTVVNLGNKLFVRKKVTRKREAKLTNATAS